MNRQVINSLLKLIVLSLLLVSPISSSETGSNWLFVESIDFDENDSDKKEDLDSSTSHFYPIFATFSLLKTPILFKRRAFQSFSILSIPSRGPPLFNS